MQREDRTRREFWVLFALLLGARLWLAARLPLFADEAFYWQESRHLAWAYSDVPGLTAWLIRLGTSVAGEHALGVRWPFLLLGSAVPWLVVLLARAAGVRRPWLAGLLALLLPLAGLLGVLALPDVPMTVAALLCLLAATRWLGQGASTGVLVLLALGLVLGGLSHYRFVLVLGAGALAWLSLAEGRRGLVHERRAWLAVALGLAAWLPLVLWNLQHGEAGWRFQFVDRHPWRLQVQGLRFLLVQAIVVTPLLFVALLQAGARCVGPRAAAERWLARFGAISLAGLFLLGFVADSERVSFHWPLPACLALLPLVHGVLAGWPGWLRRAHYGLLAGGLLMGALWLGLAGQQNARARLAGTPLYPGMFAGWQELAAGVESQLATMPAGTRLLADHFKTAAQLGFLRRDPGIATLDHRLNHHHGRARQLELWDQVRPGPAGHWQLLVLAVTDGKLRTRLQDYQALCARFGPLPEGERIVVDGGARQFLLLPIAPGVAAGPCVTPSVYHVDTPQPGSRVGRGFEVRGWVVRDGVGVRRVEILLDGEPLVRARHGLPNDWVAEVFLGGAGRDPGLPNLQFEASVRVPAGLSGWHRLGLEVESGDGRVERLPGPRILVLDEP